MAELERRTLMKLIAHVLCVMTLFALPFVVLTLVSQTPAKVDGSWYRMLAWLLCVWTYVGYIVAHLLHFGGEDDYVRERYNLATSLEITWTSLIAYSAGMALMLFYQRDMFIGLLALLVVGYRIVMTVYYEKPYFDRPREVAWEALHDLFISGSFVYVGVVTASPLWLSGGFIWFTYLVLNQYHSTLILKRGHGYAAAVLSVFVACGVFLVIVAAGVDVKNVKQAQLWLAGGALATAAKFMAPILKEIHSAGRKYYCSLWLYLGFFASVFIALLLSDELVTDVHKLAPEIQNQSDYIRTGSTLGVFLASTAFFFFTAMQALFLQMPDKSDPRRPKKARQS